MSNKLSPFEEQLKKAAEGHSVPYDANQWSKMEKKLNANSSSSSLWTKLGIASIAVFIIGYGAINLFENKFENPTVVVENIDSKPVESLLEVQVPTAVETMEVAEIDELNTNEISKDEVKTSSNETVVEQIKKVAELNEDEGLVVSEGKATKEKATTPIIEKIEPEPNKVELPKIVLVNNEICAGVELTASLNNETKGAVVWHVGNGSTVENVEFKYVYLQPGTYELKAYIEASGVFTEPQSITVKPKPDASFSLLNNMEGGMIPVEYISANTGGEKSYAWSLGDGTILQGEGISHTYKKAGDYEVSLRVLNKYGCFWTNFQRVRIEKDFNLLAPNSFSPNGDGVNDSWIPVALTSGYYNFELSVYDRNSSLIFETTDSELMFDGKSHGKMASSGDIFIWKATTIDPNGVRQEYGGTVISIY